MATTVASADGGARATAGFLKRNESAVLVVLAIVTAVVTLRGVLLPEVRDVRAEVRDVRAEVRDVRTDLAGKIDATNARIDATNDRIDRVLETLARIGHMADDIKALRADVEQLVDG